MDQRLILILFFLAAVTVAAALFTIFLSGLISTAHAAGVALPTGKIWQSPNPQDDIGYILLDRVFGVPGLTKSCVQLDTPCLGALDSDGRFPSIQQNALRMLMGFYSKMLLSVAAIIFCYHITTLVMEATRTGKPFGETFHYASVLRILIGIGLLFPAGANLCGAQWIALLAAKYGSGFASSAWTSYVGGARLSPTVTLAGDASTLIAVPAAPSPNEVVEFIATARVCQESYRLMYNKKIDAYLLPSETSFTMTFKEAMGTYNSMHGLQQYSGGATLTVSFGEYSKEKFGSARGAVHPFCGEITFTPPRSVDPGGYSFYDGGDLVSYSYLQQIVLYPWLWDKWFAANLPTLYPHPSFDVMAEQINQVYLFNNHAYILPTNEDKQATILWYNETVSAIMYDGYRAATDSTYSSISGSVRPIDWTAEETKFGWAGAGIWYNRLMAENNIFSASVAALPEVKTYPAIMELVKTEKQKAQPMVTAENVFDPNLPGPHSIQFNDAKELQIIHPMNASYALWNDFNERIKPVRTGNVIMDGMSAIFKTNGLWSLRDNRDANPIAALTSLGKTLMDNAIASLGGSAITGIMKLVAGAGHAGAILKVMSGMLFNFGMILLAAGVMLTYVIPLLPFLYFFFGVVGWLKAVFESLVAAPLWALSFVTPHGQGFFPKQSLSGLTILFGLFLRPILLLFGLVASMITFTALFSVLQEIFGLVTSNLSGFDKAGSVGVSANAPGSLSYIRAPVDQLAFTVIFVVTVYSMAISSFKMIDVLPDKIVRWAGQSAQAFGQSERADAGREVEGTLKKGLGSLGGIGH